MYYRPFLAIVKPVRPELRPDTRSDATCVVANVASFVVSSVTVTPSTVIEYVVLSETLIL